jgi:hypothetical protein
MTGSHELIFTMQLFTCFQPLRARRFLRPVFVGAARQESDVKRISVVAGILFAGAASFASAGVVGIGTASAPSSWGAVGPMAPGSYLQGPPDPPGRIFPGKYFEYKAQFYLRKADYKGALRMFEQAGYWADKRAQYNAGMMYYKGIGVPADRMRGVAWLGIAAENHDDLSDSALQTTYASLSAEEKQQAELIFSELNEKYGDAVTVPRALKQFNVETRSVVGSRVGFRGLNAMIAENGNGDSGFRPVAYFHREQDKQLDALISTVTGHVTVGQVVTLPVPPQH